MKTLICAKCGSKLDIYGTNQTGWHVFCPKCRFEYPEHDIGFDTREHLIKDYTNKEMRRIRDTLEKRKKQEINTDLRNII